MTPTMGGGRAPLLIVAGTGTGIGKTVVAEALLAAWSRRLSATTATAPSRGVAGIKPIETGGTDDVQRLERASTFHVTRFTPPYLLADPVSPHLAARREAVSIDLDVILEWVDAIRAAADAVILELAGGLFTPLASRQTNVDLTKALQPTALLLVAPDRLGALHDVIATTLAARSAGVVIDGIVLSGPEHPDSSTGTNAAELDETLQGASRVLAVIPRGVPPSEEQLEHILAELTP